MSGVWEIYALRYGVHDRPARDNFVNPPDDHAGSMPLDFYVWLIRSGVRDILVDTGFGEEAAKRRGRNLLRPVDRALKEDLGVEAATIKTVIVTHLHYDHAGSLGLFPGATFHLQEREMSFATGRHMTSRAVRHPFDVGDVVEMVRALYAERVIFHDGNAEIAPGISVHRIGGHSDGLQMVRVETARGPVVLASDASHFYANMRQKNPFPILFNLGDMVAGWDRALELAEGDEDRVIPGHDPQVRARFPEVEGTSGECVALHLPPYESAR